MRRGGCWRPRPGTGTSGCDVHTGNVEGYPLRSGARGRPGLVDQPRPRRRSPRLSPCTATASCGCGVSRTGGGGAPVRPATAHHGSGDLASCGRRACLSLTAENLVAIGGFAGSIGLFNPRWRECSWPRRGGPGAAGSHRNGHGLEAPRRRTHGSWPVCRRILRGGSYRTIGVAWWSGGDLGVNIPSRSGTAIPWWRRIAGTLVQPHRSRICGNRRRSSRARPGTAGRRLRGRARRDLRPR